MGNDLITVNGEKFDINLAMIEDIYQQAFEYENNSQFDDLKALNIELEEFEKSTYQLRNMLKQRDLPEKTNFRRNG